MKSPTKLQREFFENLRQISCAIRNSECAGAPAIHHAGTSMGGRKDHDKVICLCYEHHQGKHGIHTIGRRAHAERYGNEEQLMLNQQDRLEALCLC